MISLVLLYWEVKILPLVASLCRKEFSPLGIRILFLPFWLEKNSILLSLFAISFFDHEYNKLSLGEPNFSMLNHRNRRKWKQCRYFKIWKKISKIYQLTLFYAIKPILEMRWSNFVKIFSNGQSGCSIPEMFEFLRNQDPDMVPQDLKMALDWYDKNLTEVVNMTWWLKIA